MCPITSVSSIYVCQASNTSYSGAYSKGEHLSLSPFSTSLPMLRFPWCFHFSSSGFPVSLFVSSFCFLLHSPRCFGLWSAASMEKRDMSYHRHYKQRDFDFAHQLATLRRRAKLTQEEVALRIGVTEKSIRNWEGGSNYPSELNLRKMIELYLDHDVFAPGQERDEACLFWELLHERNPSRMSYFDERWFATLFTPWQTRHTQQTGGHQPYGPPHSSEQ